MEEKEKNFGNRKYDPPAGRLEYLNQLVVEFKSTSCTNAKEQVLANLANFTFNAINFEFLRQLNVIDIFLDTLSSKEETLVKFSIGGLCNASVDPIGKKHIIKKGLERIKILLRHSDETILLSTITTLMYLITPESKQEITSPDVVKTIFKLSKSSNCRLKNLAIIFLEDHCSKKQIKELLMENESKIAPVPESQT